MTRSEVMKIFAVAAVLLAAFTATAQAHPGDRAAHRSARTTVPSIRVNIYVTLTDTKVTLSRNSAPRGDDAVFYFRNIGRHVRSFQLGDADHAGFQRGLRVNVLPGKQKMIVLYLDYRSKIPYFSTPTADRNNTKMRGVFTIA